MVAINRPVRVGVDIRDLRVAKTGQKTVLEEFCRKFAVNQDPEITFIFFDSSASTYTGTNKWRIRFEHIRLQYWKQIVLPIKAWRKKCDVVFCCDYFVPYIHLGFKTTEFMYDAFFFENPQHYNKPFLKLFHAIAMPAARRCARIMTITDYSKKRIHELAGFPIDQLVTVYLGSKTMHAEPDDQTVRKWVTPGRKYLLHVGVMEKRKNLPSLIKAFDRLIRQGYDDIDLVLVGQGNGKQFSDDSKQVEQAIADCGLEKRIICTGYLADNEVAAFYKDAFLYVFPSFNEGFGIPVLEAFRFGVPSIVANNTALPEVGGDAVLYFDPHDINDIYQKIKKAVDDEALRNDLIQKGKERLQLFSWDRSTRQLVQLFKEIARED